MPQHLPSCNIQAFKIDAIVPGIPHQFCRSMAPLKYLKLAKALESILSNVEQIF